MGKCYFSPVPKKIYEGNDGDKYICISSNEHEHEAVLQVIGVGKWTFTAHNCYMKNGLINWENSTDGFFAFFSLYS